MIVVAPLLDGPQLSSRWAARYASILADDPGSAVLTLTSFGMAQRSGLPGQNPSPVVALWKSPGQQTREIPLEPGAQGILLSASITRATRRSFDGRRPGDNSSEFSAVSVHQVRASSTGTGSQRSLAGSPSRPMLAAEELTILASWAQAVAEAITFAPERIEAVTADAQAGALWRAELRIREPSIPLQHSISGMSHAVQPGAAAGRKPPPDAVLLAVHDGQPAGPTLNTLGRAALRSALDQRHTQPADERGPRHGRSATTPKPTITTRP
jgi:hypothetical protein